MRSERIVAGQIYHICNRSTEGIKVFSDKIDVGRFLQTMFYANNKNPVMMSEVLKVPKKLQNMLLRDQKPLVEIYILVLMPNHFHICVKSLVDDGISVWLQRVCNSYARYYNIKYQRKGILFMGRFQCIPVIEDRQLFHLFVYIHANPLDLIVPRWREGMIDDWQAARSFLRSYCWSSFNLYANGADVIPEIRQLISTDFPSEILASLGGLENGIRDWSQRDYEESKNIFLE